MTLWDQTKGMLRFDVDTGRWTVPKGLDADLQQQIVNHPSGARVAVDEGGTKRIYAFARMKSPLRPHGVSVVLEIPEAVALAASKRTFLRNLILLALSALTAVFLHLVDRQCVYPQTDRGDRQGQSSARRWRLAGTHRSHWCA